MLIPALLPFRRRRGRQHRAPPAPPPPPLALLSVENVSFDGSQGTFEAVFNVPAGQSLSDVSAADPSKWSARFNDTLYLGTVLQNLAFDRLFITLLVNAPDSGPNELNYANAPSDVSDTLGRQLAAFAGFPL